MGDYIVKKPKGEYYKFKKINNTLVLNIGNAEETIVIEEDIDKYSLALDEEDKIHILYLTKNGELKYAIHNEQFESISIMNTKKHHKIDFIKVNVFLGTIHLFYIIRNLESRNEYLYYSFLSDKKWISKRISKTYNSGGNFNLYIQNCKDKMFLLFCPKKNVSEYKFMRLIQNSMEWVLIDKLILRHIEMIRLYLDNNVAMISYSKNIDNERKKIICFKDLEDKNTSWFSKMLPKDMNVPKIFYIDGAKYILSQNTSNLTFSNLIYRNEKSIIKYSKEQFNRKFKLYSFIIISKEEKELKLQRDSIKVLNILIPLLITNFKTEAKQKEKSKNLKLLLDELEKKEDYVNYLLDEMKSKDRIINYEYLKNEYLSEKINLQTDKLNTSESKVQELFKNCLLKSQDCSKLIYKYENEIMELREEKEKLINNINLKFNSLLEIIDKKEKLIEKMRKGNE